LAASGGGQAVQCVELVQNVLKRDSLQFAAPRERVRKGRERGFDRFAAQRKAVEEAGTVEILDARHARGVGLRFQVAPVGQLRQRHLDFLQGRRRNVPCRFQAHFVRTKLQAELSLGRSEGIHDQPIQLCLIRTDVPEQVTSCLRCSAHQSKSDN
jgi:hypothetical protein